jgi:hypothetical protein
MKKDLDSWATFFPITTVLFILCNLTIHVGDLALILINQFLDPTTSDSITSAFTPMNTSRNFSLPETHRL